MNLNEHIETKISSKSLQIKVIIKLFFLIKHSNIVAKWLQQLFCFETFPSRVNSYCFISNNRGSFDFLSNCKQQKPKQMNSEWTQHALATKSIVPCSLQVKSFVFHYMLWFEKFFTMHCVNLNSNFVFSQLICFRKILVQIVMMCSYPEDFLWQIRQTLNKSLFYIFKWHFSSDVIYFDPSLFNIKHSIHALPESSSAISMIQNPNHEPIVRNPRTCHRQKTFIVVIVERFVWKVLGMGKILVQLSQSMDHI